MPLEVEAEVEVVVLGRWIWAGHAWKFPSRCIGCFRGRQAGKQAVNQKETLA